MSEGVKNLEKGEGIALDTYLDILEPAIMSDLFLYKGLSYMEMGNAGLAHISFKNMFFVF
ncbi:MAG: hypothetical protein FJ088_11205, partial [Deltaproteobacteria bacterium]|nr:hypothetical protein [Deltaproteobacteria bacterium]